ncbi:Hypothetical predicted protein [Olea europaea subsp. europaea]|uniref:Uncharacterized protein n=1 Tax=Olea europaea subsp. europaea TaxID=158383 RepID=A0A8S0S4U6_OLEEU|nr:Hypothetical predicted protein [Olea europaea subsp. europaea]
MGGKDNHSEKRKDGEREKKVEMAFRIWEEIRLGLRGRVRSAVHHHATACMSLTSQRSVIAVDGHSCGSAATVVAVIVAVEHGRVVVVVWCICGVL